MLIDSITKQKGTTTTAKTNRNKSGDTWQGDTETESVDTATQIATPEIERRMKLEEALTRVQGRLQKAIETWHKMEMDAEKLAIDQAKLEIQRQRLIGQVDLDDLTDADDLGLDL